MKGLRLALSALLAMAFAALLGWSFVVFSMYSLQDSLVFPIPGGVERTGLDQSAAELGVTAFDLTAADGTTLYAWYREGARPGACAVLYLHGNGGTVAGSSQLLRWVTARGCDFMAIAYRGYPGSTGAPSEEGLARDARAAFDWLVARGLPPERIVVHGQSLGGGVAVRLASEVQPGFLVLESTFTSVMDLAEERYGWLPVRRLLRHEFASARRLPLVRSAVLITHSVDDGTIPVAHGRALARSLPSARYVETKLWNHGDSLVLADPAVREAYAAGLSWVASSERSSSPWP